MLPKYLAYFLISLLLLVTSCQQTTNPGGKLWFYTHSTDNEGLVDSTLTPASFINLERDGSYTSDLGHFDYGKWIYANKQLVFISHQQNKSVLPVSYLTNTEMQSGPPRGPFNNFESQPVSFASNAENPFSKDNNQWRIKAVGKETDAQIKARLLNHFRFWEVYFTWALNYNVQYIDVRSTPTPVKIYGNGFGLKPIEQLPATWKDYFYDEADCNTANQKIKHLFDTDAIAWPHTDNKYKMFISAFQQLQKKIQ